MAGKIRDHELTYIVVVPVMVATSGDRLLQESAIDALKMSLIPLATVVTPNIDEAIALTGLDIHNLEDMKEAAQQIHKLGAQTVLIKGGHLAGVRFETGTTPQISDVLFAGEAFTVFKDSQIPTTSTHGTGCTLSAEIAAGLSRGRPVSDAIADAKAYLTDTLSNSFPMGKGQGPVNHLFGWWSGNGADGRGGARTQSPGSPDRRITPDDRPA